MFRTRIPHGLISVLIVILSRFIPFSYISNEWVSQWVGEWAKSEWVLRLRSPRLIYFQQILTISTLFDHSFFQPYNKIWSNFTNFEQHCLKSSYSCDIFCCQWYDFDLFSIGKSILSSVSGSGLPTRRIFRGLREIIWKSYLLRGGQNVSNSKY